MGSRETQVFLARRAMSGSDNDDDKLDRLAADRLRALGRHDLVSQDGKLWWNGEQWEPIALSLNLSVSSAEEMTTEPHTRHGIERFMIQLPSKEELRGPANAQEQVQQAQAAIRAWSQLPPPKPEPPLGSEDQAAETLQEAKRLIETERQVQPLDESLASALIGVDESLAIAVARNNERLIAIKWWSNHTGWLVVSLCIAVPTFLIVRYSWWFLIGYPVAVYTSLVIQRYVGGTFVRYATGRIRDAGQEITWPGNLFIFVIVPLALLGHLFGKI